MLCARSLAAAIALSLAVCASARGADFTVTRSDDGLAAGASNDGQCLAVGGGCTLRAAAAEAGNTPGPDRVIIGARTVTLTLGVVNLKDTTELAGSGARLTIIRQGASNGLLVQDSGVVTIRDLTLRDANGGAAFAINAGTATMDAVAVVDNAYTTPGVRFGGAIFVFNGASLAIGRSLIARNTATSTSDQALGGGVFSGVGSTLSITDSTIAANDAVPTGAPGYGGGVAAEGGLTLRRTTLYGNRAFGNGQGGNLYASTSTVIEDSVFAAGEDGAARNCVFFSQAPLLQGRSLDSGHSCFAAGPSAIVDTDPKLAPLANAGGQSDVLAPLVGSPLVDAGTACTSASSDQRGRPRPIGSSCDIGAVEQGTERRVAVTTARPTLIAGEDETWITRVVNDGPDPSPAAVSLSAPGPVVLAQASAGSCAGTAPVVCDLGTIAPGGSVDVSLVVTLATPGVATFTATVSGTVTDPTPADDIASASATVTPASAGTPTPTAPPDPKACLTLLVGSTRGDRLKGAALGDRLLGLDGKDSIDGAAGDDCLEGGPGSDSLKGGAGTDRLLGESGNDKLDGGSGDDRLDGGSGNDRLTGAGGKDTIAGGSGRDRVSARDKAKDTITCGSGRDSVSADKIDKVGRDCESIRRR